MNISVIRGSYQIGGSIIEVCTKRTKLIFDIGVNLDDGDNATPPYVEGLFQGGAQFDAVFISHYHPDHFGLVNSLVSGIPVFVGEGAVKVIKAANSYLKKEQPLFVNFIEDEKPIHVGDVTVTPYVCDHSAFDSYMFLIEAGDQKVLYTGDFRANGRKDFNELLAKLPKVESLIIEGTTLTREKTNNITESELEDIAINALQKHLGPAFVMMSAQNADRLTTVYNISKRTGRIFAQDIYTAMIGRAINSCQLPYHDNATIKVFTHNNSDANYRLLTQFNYNKISRQVLSKSKYIMCVRPTLKSYLEKLAKLQSFKNGILFYSMWQGYKEKEYISDFLEYMQNKGVKIHTLHTSGHADEDTIRRLIEQVTPRKIIPVHTENLDWFKDNYGEKCEG